MNSFLKVTAITTHSDKNNRLYQKVTFSEVEYLPNGIEVQTGKVRTRNLWSANDQSKGDTLYGTLQVGSYVKGSIQTFNTTSYEINGREVNQTTQVIFGFENPINYVNQQLKQNGACVVDEHGQLTGKIPATYKQAAAVAVEGDDDWAEADPADGSSF